MKHEAIVNDMVDLLRQHHTGQRGSIYQEPYKGDLFRLFADVFNEGPGQIGSLTADAVIATICERAPELAGSKELSSFYSMWREWLYAWHHIDQMRGAKSC